ncbi:MAG: hypothetical protein CMI54_04755 [Parcubacteria group bacterium]|nr:hypothetical protein [Parcubacteria group bacterium]
MINNMTVSECVEIMKRYHLPKDDFLAWTDSNRDVFCQHYYNALERPIYDFNPYTQGELLCESLGLPERLWKTKLRIIKEKFESYFEDDMRGLTSCCTSFL